MIHHATFVARFFAGFFAPELFGAGAFFALGFRGDLSGMTPLSLSLVTIHLSAAGVAIDPLQVFPAENCELDRFESDENGFGILSNRTVGKRKRSAGFLRSVR